MDSEPWYVEDIWDNYDPELLERFNKEMVVPNYPKDGKCHSLRR